MDGKKERKRERERKMSKDVPLDVLLQNWIYTYMTTGSSFCIRKKKIVQAAYLREIEKERMTSRTSPYLLLHISPRQQLQGKVEEAYNKIVKNEFLAVEKHPGYGRWKGKILDVCQCVYNNIDREHGGIGGLTPQERWLQLLNTPTRNKNRLKKSVT
ncbi:MAG TPA: hypothetical protein VNI77_10685 [Nitrososphaera sp.]|nr:hypothetical protein [Nitrososphaera sp.]